jgi:hypothetical protein
MQSSSEVAGDLYALLTRMHSFLGFLYLVYTRPSNDLLNRQLMLVNATVPNSPHTCLLRMKHLVMF